MSYSDIISATQLYSNLLNKTRMKPPLTRMRYGDLYNGGDEQKTFTGLMGFINSLTYTIPDTSTWEIENGRQVPKHVETAISYTVIHDEVPDQDTKFYGYKQPKSFLEAVIWDIN